MRTIFTVIFLVSIFGLNAQNREHAFDVNKRLGRGINYGNMFEAPSENEWGNPWKPQYARMIAQQGFKHIRVPIRWEPADRSSATAPYTISSTFLNRVKQVVDSALRNKLHVIINMHHHEALFANPDGQKARFLEQWNQISTFFKDYPDSLLFEILNEPNGNITPAKWNVFMADALKEIRKTSPTRVVLIGTAEWGGLGGLPYLQLPDDENIIVTVHYYNPFQFTHQGASWVGNGTEANAWLGTKWNDSETEREVVQNEFAPLVQFSKTKKVPVHIGEFGAYSMADDTSRKKWTTYIARYLESVNFSWAYWEFSAGFGIYKPSNNSWNQFLVDALIRNPLPEPARYIGTPVYSSNFISSVDGWVLQQSSGSAVLSRNNNQLKVAVSNGGTEGWHIQLMKSGIKLAQGKKYRFSVMAKADSLRPATCYIGMNASPWSSYSGYTSMSLADTFFVYNFLFDMKTTDNNARIVFDIGKSVSDVTITAVKLEEVELQWPTSAVTEPVFESQVYPNPWNDRLYINNLDEFETVSVINLQGRIIATSKIVPLLNQVAVENINPGLYFIRLARKDRELTLKVVKN